MRVLRISSMDIMNMRDENAHKQALEENGFDLNEPIIVEEDFEKLEYVFKQKLKNKGSN